MHPLTTMPELVRATQYLDVLVWTAPNADMGWHVLMGNPKELLGLTPSELEHYTVDADWPGLRCQDATLRQRLLLNARTQGEASGQYALARNGHLEWLEERVVYRDKGWHGLIRRLSPSPVVTRPVREGAAPELVDTLLDVSREAKLLARLEIMTERIPGLIFQFRRTLCGQLSFPYLAGNDHLLKGLDPHALALDASPALERIPEEDLTALMIAIERSVQRHTPLATQLRLHQPDGSLRWAAARAQPETSDDGGTLWHGVLLDISDQVAHEAQLRELSDTDDLTGLANRRRLMQRLDEEMSRARRHGSALTLLLLDLDHFKHVNDTWGHLKGDQVLREIATLCRETLRHEDVVARFGGEEMAILLPLTPLEDGLRLAERLRQIIADHDYGIQQGSVTASLGVAEYIDGDTTDTLIERTDRGLYAAKHDGRNRVVSIQ